MTHTSIDLNLHLTSDADIVEKTVSTLGKELSLRNKKQYAALKLLLANLYYYSDRKIAVSRKREGLGAMRYNPFNIGYSSLIQVLDRLVDTGLIQQELGRKELRTGKGKLTLIHSTDLLNTKLHVAEWTPDLFKEVNPEVLWLRSYDSHGNKKLTDYVDDDRTLMLKQQIYSYWSLLVQSEICLDPGASYEWEYDGEPIHRSFIKMTDSGEQFTYGGRLYGPWASLSKQQRKRILMNGQVTVEHDFAASHVNTMYIMQTGSPYPFHDDPYAIEVHNQPIPRHIVKKLSSIMINVKSVAGAILSLEKEYSSYSDFEGEKLTKLYEFNAMRDSLALVDVIDAYFRKHHLIRKLFLKGKKMGNYIQYMESCRVMDIVNHFVAMGIPVLTIFDSFVIAKEYEALLLEQMNKHQSIEKLAA